MIDFIFFHIFKLYFVIVKIMNIKKNIQKMHIKYKNSNFLQKML